MLTYDNRCVSTRTNEDTARALSNYGNEGYRLVAVVSNGEPSNFGSTVDLYFTKEIEVKRLGEEPRPELRADPSRRPGR